MPPPSTQKRPVKLVAWLLDDGTPGHWSMTEGLACLLAEHRDLESHRIRVHWRIGVARQLFQWAARLRLKIPNPIRNSLLQIEVPEVAPCPGLIISRGGATLYANAWLARAHNAPNIFIGTLRKMPPSNFSAVILQRNQGDHPPYVSLPLAPTRIVQQALPAKADAFAWTSKKPSGEIACLMIGGNGSGHLYQKQDWVHLAQGINRLQREFGLSCCISTSRRTPPDAETLLRECIDKEAIAEACWWHDGDRRPCLEAFLGVAQHAYCTSDSMSMIEECAAAGLPVLALVPSAANPPASFAAFLSRREQAGRMRRLPLAEFANSDKDPAAAGDWHPVQPGDMSAAVTSLLATLRL